jgi:photosystem II stability/assembly factor-like uncharacterized protein
VRKRIAIAVCAGLAAACIGVAASGAVVTTSQSGWTWGSPRPQGHDMLAIDAAGGRAYAVGAFGTLLRTDDGGASWSGIRTALTDDLTAVSVADADNVLAAGGCQLVRSADGGRKLRRRTLPCSSPIAALDLATPTLAYVVRADRRVLRISLPFNPAPRTRLPAGGGRPNDAAFTSVDDGVVVTGAGAVGRIFRTTNGGGSWNAVYSGRGVRSVFFVDSSDGYAVGDNIVLHSSDGGASWQPKPAPGRNLIDVSCGDPTHCVAVTANRIVVYTDDGFATLHQSSVNPGSPGTRVPESAASFTSSTHVVAVGEEGYTWTSNDGGLGFDRATSARSARPT